MSILTLDRPTFALELRTVDATSARRARHWAGWILEGLVPQDALDAVLLAASELVTNAYRHTDSQRALVSVQVLDAAVRLIVHDDAAPVDDSQAPAGGLAEHGRGLILVQALAEQLDITTHAAGTTVSALIPTGA